MAELDRFKAALDKSIRQLRELSTEKTEDGGQPVSGIFSVHLLILESSLVDKVEKVISTQRVNAEWAIRTVLDDYVDRQESVSDLHIKEKYLDLEDVTNRLLSALGSVQTPTETDSNAIIVARDLTPSQIMELAKSKPAALITENGGWTSHSSILAREFRLPMVSGVRDIEHLAQAGEQAIVDGNNGEVILNPGDRCLAGFQELAAHDLEHKRAVCTFAGTTKTLDGTSIVIRANLDHSQTYEAAAISGAEGIGLFRSESLILKPGLIPSEEEQFNAYRNLADAVGEVGVNIRTFDIGSEQLGDGSGRAERNPALGLRSLRLSLLKPVHFRAQIRALLRASFEREINIILPTISGVSEILRAKDIIEDEIVGLSIKRTEIGSPKIGAMIEVPSAIFTINDIVRNVDFLCIGTNDLVQYLLAVDRDNDAVADLYQTLHPAVIRAVSKILSAASDAEIPVSVCGEMAGSPFYVPVLVGLGAREFSMNVNSIQPVRRLLSGISAIDAAKIVEMIKPLKVAADIEAFLSDYYGKNLNGLFPPGLLDVRHR